MTASTSSAATAAQPPAFAAASRNHYRAATLASEKDLRISADHLAGLAAECAVKAILIDFLGSRLNARNMPEHPEVKYLDRSRRTPQWTNKHGHLPELWEHLTAVAHRRRGGGSGALFTQLIWENPFADWDVGDRYCDGTAITDTILERHLKAAYDLIAAHEQAGILGTRTRA
ncbi:hypothetical protein HLK59_11685 [Streptomyces sp. S3(2020)]|uniref:hypothetical protein n=1 Tax=Streptomyces sp. S3(2020) TaxID=2732044 RepID=UPI00148948A6|nr:hypothetical protein [Streptomyces sp. S3(2020)]NNN31020.1 hypothetical protein [Streptomyces sp. S3(2020)]